MGFDGGEAGVRAAGIGGIHGDGLVEQGDIVELLGIGDDNLSRREDSRGQEVEENW